MENNIAGILIKDLKPLAIKYEGNDSFESLQRTAIKISVARAARLSYMTFDGEIDYEKDIALYDQLLKSHHMSPFEHCARAMDEEEYYTFRKGQLSINSKGVLYDDSDKDTFGWCRNFKGFIPYRYLIENEKNTNS